MVAQYFLRGAPDPWMPARCGWDAEWGTNEPSSQYMPPDTTIAVPWPLPTTWYSAICAPPGTRVNLTLTQIADPSVIAFGSWTAEAGFPTFMQVQGNDVRTMLTAVDNTGEMLIRWGKNAEAGAQLVKWT